MSRADAVPQTLCRSVLVLQAAAHRSGHKHACMQAKDLQEWQECPEDFVTRELEGAGFRDSLRPCAETLLSCLFEVGLRCPAALREHGRMVLRRWQGTLGCRTRPMAAAKSSCTLHAARCTLHAGEGAQAERTPDLQGHKETLAPVLAEVLQQAEAACPASRASSLQVGARLSSPRSVRLPAQPVAC